MNYLIIGSTSDIGVRLIQMLLEDGNYVYGISRADSAISHSNYYHRITDILDEEPFPEDFLPDELHGLVYLPGTIHLKPFRAIKDEQYMEDFRVNVLGAIKSIRWANKKLSEGSSILLFSTVAVQTGMPYHSSIAASKGAVEGLTRSLAAEFSPGIRVNCIAPSLTDTKLAERLLNTEERRAISAERHPLKRVGSRDDIAEMAGFLLSSRSGWVTGQIIQVDGGISSIRK